MGPAKGGEQREGLRSGPLRTPDKRALTVREKGSLSLGLLRLLSGVTRTYVS